MSLAARPEAPPLREDTAGALRIGESQVLLELVIWAFQDGATPETIVQRYPTLTLGDAYATIAYYLRHPDEVESYLAGRERMSADIQEKIEGQQGNLSEIRARLNTRRQSQASAMMWHAS